MRRYIILFLITGIVWAQTEFDKLVLKDGTTFWGEYSNTEKEMVYFKPQNSFAFQTPEFDKLVLKDGTTFWGEYSKTEKQIVYFKPQNAFAFQPVPVQLIKKLRLKEFQPVPIKLIKFIKLKDGSVTAYLGRELTLPVKINRKIDPVWNVYGIMILIFGLILWKNLKDINISDVDWWPDGPWPGDGHS